MPTGKTTRAHDGTSLVIELAPTDAGRSFATAAASRRQSQSRCTPLTPVGHTFIFHFLPRERLPVVVIDPGHGGH